MNSEHSNSVMIHLLLAAQRAIGKLLAGLVVLIYSLSSFDDSFRDCDYGSRSEIV